MILAAGLGTRLGELGQSRPKPMLPVCGTPLVRWSVLWLKRFGVREIVVNLHHKGEQIEAELGDGSALGVSIAYSREVGQILGTGGGLRHARPLLDDGSDRPIVIVNGKVLLDLDLQAVLDRHRARDAEATMVLRADDEADKWGSFRLAEDGTVVRMLGREAPAGSGDPVGPPLMFTGVHVVQTRFLDRIPKEGAPCVIRTAYRELFDEGRGLHAFVTDRYWWEHSTTERYLQGVFNVLDGRVSLPYAEHRLSGVDPTAVVDPTATLVEPVWVGPGAVIEAGSRVGPHVQLGAGAQVAAGVTVTRAVVWDAVRIDADLHEAVAAFAPAAGGVVAR